MTKWFLMLVALGTGRALGGTVITANLPANTAIVNISGTQDGAAGFDGSQDRWYHPFFTGGATGLLQYTIQPGTYTFHLINPSLATTQFPALNSAQLGEIFTAWTFNSPWITDYMVFDSAAATNFSLPQLFSGGIAPSGDPGATSSATAAFDHAEMKGYANTIVDSPGGRYTGTVASARTFATAETLIFIVPDSILSDNQGGVSVLISPASGLAGDFDLDDDVDGADFLKWQRGQSPHSGSSAELADWRANFGIGTASTHAIPEPAALLLALGMAGLTCRKNGARRRAIASMREDCRGR